MPKLRLMKLTAALAAGLTLAACGAKSHYVLAPPVRPLSAFKNVEVKPFTVEKTVMDSLKEEKQGSLEALTDMIAPQLRENLKRRNLSVSDQRPDRLIIEGAVISYNPGSQALRYLIGFGAGSSKIVTEVRFKDADENVIAAAEFVGGVSAGMFGGDKKDGVKRLTDEIARYVTKSNP